MSTAPPTLDFYFDFISPYAYFGWVNLQALLQRVSVDVQYHPVVYPQLCKHWENTPLATVPPKRMFATRDAVRYAITSGIPFRWPVRHPFRPYLPLRTATREVAGAEQPVVMRALWEACWQRGADISQEAEVVAALEAAGLDGRALVARAGEAPGKQALMASTQSAVARGVFGVPTMFVGDELFWGRDQFPYIEAALGGRDPLRQAPAEAYALPASEYGLSE